MLCCSVSVSARKIVILCCEILSLPIQCNFFLFFFSNILFKFACIFICSTINMRERRSCCGRLCERLMCCKKKEVIESRRTSMNSKKQSIAPTLPPEDTRPKIDESLVDHTSMMKAAIPVLPVSLAWFCLICNCLIPGFGMYMCITLSITVYGISTTTYIYIEYFIKFIRQHITYQHTIHIIILYT